MNRFLFSDGQTVTEVHNAEDLHRLAEACLYPEKVKVWIFNSSEWISYDAFLRKYPSRKVAVKTTPKDEVPLLPVKKQPAKWMNRILFLVLLVGGALLVFNFTNVKWSKDEPLQVAAARPTNAPQVNIDSMISMIEYERQKALDRNTRTNYRLRNSWPERILLQLKAEKESSSAGNRFSNLQISIDNTTGYTVDNAIVNLWVWKNGEAELSDTLKFSDILFDQLSVRKVNNIIKADSISLSYGSIRAKAFNFCYSEKTKNNSGNRQDPWFCILKN